MASPLGMIRIGHLSVAEAGSVSDRLDDETEALAVSMNETDEAAGEWEVLAYYPDEAAAWITARLLGQPDVAVASVPEIDWVRRSLEGLGAVAAGRFYLHGSHDRARRRTGGISLEIDAGTAFGTGHHPTTLGCLRAFDQLLKCHAPRRILDVGCGTGVLALAAAKARHVRVVASDIDPEAVAVTIGNGRRNGLTPWLTALVASGVADARVQTLGPYDLIFANILALPLIKLAGSLSRLAAPQARIILSGLTISQERAVFAAYREHGFARQSRIRDGNWATLVLRRLPNVKRPAAEAGRAL